MQRVLALDVGDRRIGVAVSDPLGMTAQGIETYQRTGDDEKDVAHFVDLLKGYAPVKLVVGMPRNMNGTYGPQTEKVRSFAEAICAVWNGELEYCDERLTTMSAERVLIDADVSRQKRKKVIDKMAAVIILQSYLDRNV